VNLTPVHQAPSY